MLWRSSDNLDSIMTSIWLALLLGMLLAGTNLALAAENGATAGALLALRNEALSYEHGEGVAKDVPRAIALYCKGSRLGDADSQFMLGWLYAHGRGIQRDDALSAYFFDLAGKQGHPQAQQMLQHVGNAPTNPPACMLDADAIELPDLEKPRTTSPLRRKVIDLVHKLAPQYGIYPRLAMAVIQAESNYDPAAVSTKNAQGLMQLIPETAARFNVTKPFDPEQNIRGGLSYLRWLLAYFKGDVALVAAAYNAGEGTVNRYRGIPPYAETRGYVKRIMAEFQKDEHPYDRAVTEPSPDLSRIQLRRLM